MFAWFFISALYLQFVLGYDPLQVGLAFLPANLIMAAFSLGLSARLVMRFGIRLPIVAGLLLAAVGLAVFARAPVEGCFIVDVLPGMLLLGLAVLACLAAAGTDQLPASGASTLDALNDGYRVAFVVAAAFAATSASE